MNSKETSASPAQREHARENKVASNKTAATAADKKLSGPNRPAE